LLFLVQPRLVYAGTGSQTGRYPVDGGEILEEASSLNHEANLRNLDDSFGKVTPNSATELPDIRIMPLGDSITKGYGTCTDQDTTALDCIGYREDLWNSLIGDGYSVDFVGSLGWNYQYHYTYDNDHEGHGGKTADWMINQVYGPTEYFLLDNPADIVLLHIGTNDFSGSPPYDPNSVASRVSQILDKIDDFEIGEGKKTLVILAKIIRRYDSPERITAIENFNDALQTMADLRIAGGDNIIVVDMEPALIYDSDYYDPLHPNATGYSKMAAVWYPAIVDALNFPPTSTNPGVQTSFQGQMISMQMQATDPENDTLTYSAIGLPPGLTINSGSGEISGKISSSVPTGTEFNVTVTADDKTGFPYTDPYNKDQVSFNWQIGEYVVLPLVNKH
jgi:lysophospholipase L1-like esterase